MIRGCLGGRRRNFRGDENMTRKTGTKPPKVLNPQPEDWEDPGCEPLLGELMDDPMVALIMRRDNIGKPDVVAAMKVARR